MTTLPNLPAIGLNDLALAVYLELDEASGSTAFDSSLYGKDGTVVNMENGDLAIFVGDWLL